MNKLNKLGIIAVCVIVLSALTTTATFSWLVRPGTESVTGKTMVFDATAVVKTDGVTATTYLAKIENGELIVGDKLTTTGEITVDAGKVQYFRTVVSNEANKDNDNNILLGGLLLSNGANITVSCLSPLKTTADYSEGMAITQHLTVGAGDTLNVDWYIYNKSSTSASKFTIQKAPEVLYYN